ncbi:protein smoothened [Anopheles darlingi]|uniref:protein smoothened n=1 Tax=Anopheles darlingi TaxID=43151 RepID=UPI0021000A22|nr:protein smoothened [Anopheles darlingi]
MMRFWMLMVLGSFVALAKGKEFNPTTNLITPETFRPMLEPINGTHNYRMHGKKGKDDKTWFDGREMRYIYCVRPAKCQPIRHKSCLGATLPYSSISLDLSDSYSQEEVHDKLYQYNALRHVPKCWAVIQPFLCAVFTPKCEKINGQEMVYLPSLEMCRITLEPCRILYNTSFFPAFLRCNETLYPSKCNNDVREEMKFNATGQCLKPLVAADLPANYYKDVDGCGLQCKDPLYSDDEHRQIHKLIAWGAGVCLTFNFFTLATFAIDWHNANKYPALVIFYINFCFAISCLGWLAQFTPGGREDIVCRKDGTLRTSEPSAGENLSCIVVFILVYYFLIAAMVWFVIFTYVWHMSFKAIGKIQDRIDKKGSYFHLIAWSLPLVLTITIMALSEIDGNSTVGICFVGYLNHPIRAGLLLGPVCCVLLVGGYFLGRGLLTLIRLRISSKEIISARASRKIHQTIVRMGICTTFIFVFIVATVVCHAYEFRHSASWATALRDYIVCQIETSFTDDLLGGSGGCRIIHRPSVAILQVHLLCLFASGIVMSSWVWTNSTLESWGRYFRRRFGTDTDEPVKLQKHKVIAQAFAKRKEFQNQGRLSISFHNSHTDPVGLKFDINSAIGSHDFSSTWANNLPRFVNRRCALTGAATSSASHDPRKNSVDSEISFSVRHVSVESRRNSIDSQVSVKIAEVKTKVASRSTRGTVSGAGASGKHHHHHHKATRSSRRRDFGSAGGGGGGVGRRYSRKESSTSVESQIITAALHQQKVAGSSHRGRHSGMGTTGAGNMQRRTGIGALDAEQINDLIANGKLLLPFLAQQGLTTSEDDNASVGSFKLHDSRFDIILKQIESGGHSHADASLVGGRNDGVSSGVPGTGVSGGCRIEEYRSTDDDEDSEDDDDDDDDVDDLKAERKAMLNTGRTMAGMRPIAASSIGREAETSITHSRAAAVDVACGDSSGNGALRSSKDGLTTTGRTSKSTITKGSSGRSRKGGGTTGSSRHGTLRKSQLHHHHNPHHPVRTTSMRKEREKKEKARAAAARASVVDRDKELELLERVTGPDRATGTGTGTSTTNDPLYDFNDSSFTSYCSELSPLNVNSSYSGVSIAKTNSRNSKRSCDVGIQTNAHEIATQTMSSFEFSEKALKNEENEDIYTENHQLLPKLLQPAITMPATNTVGRKHRDVCETGMSDAEKLKMLLLPSK